MRKLNEANKSGAGAKDVNVRLSDIFPRLSWLDPYFSYFHKFSPRKLLQTAKYRVY